MPPVALFDTNIWVSALLNPAGPPAQLLEEWYGNRVTIVTSLPLLEELSDVLTRPRLRRKYDIRDRDVGTLLRLLATRTRLVPITRRITVCRDPDDNVVLESAIGGEAKYLVTGDDDLKQDRTVRRYLRRYGIRVMSAAQFLVRISAEK